MNISRLAQEIYGFQIISLSDGQILGKVDDLLVDLKERHIAAIVTSKGSVLRRKIEAVPRKSIQVWGQEVILVVDPDVIIPEDRLSGFEEWQLLSSQVVET